ncbi:beta-ketoacyl synthase chain length factor [Myxococcota bacterium]|nr:beta-ketoacyl synthase chain length factor [Myxococcota bacterium]
MKRVYVRGIGFWTTGYPSVTAWTGKKPEAEAQKPEASLLQGPLRRRATPLTRMSVEVMQQALKMAKADAAKTPSVWATAHGEHSTAIGLLDMMLKGEGKLSPTKFHNSVHNTPSGYASISAKNRSPSTTLTGGAELVASAFCEAGAMVSALNRDVVLVLADEPLMSPFDSPNSTRPLAISFLLSANPERALGAISHLQKRPDRAPDGPSEIFGRLHVAAGLFLIEAIIRGETGVIPLQWQESAGSETWSVEFESPTAHL